MLANAKQFVDPNLKILAKAAEALPEFENKFRDKFGYGDEPVDERGENDEDDDVQEEEDAEEEEDDTKKGTKSNKKNKKVEENDEDKGDEFTVPKDKPSIGDGSKKKKQPSWWEEGASNRNTTTPLFVKKKREEMKNPAMRDMLRCGPNDEEIQINARKWKRKSQRRAIPRKTKTHRSPRPRNLWALNRDLSLKKAKMDWDTTSTKSRKLLSNVGDGSGEAQTKLSKETKVLK